MPPVIFSRCGCRRGGEAPWERGSTFCVDIFFMVCIFSVRSGHI
ncbi:hypothetical protein E2C01_079448 [Portunus trituberculatus]|uniref:Uncharacterized protein n=1 Tax=Portunus trituberculatus TaxID=210409 RepID=A0A5B7IGZ0_PORTR|nr:hypothetical protein [Portunus trituberculatus]